jgi:hypothetical protein
VIGLDAETKAACLKKKGGDNEMENRVTTTKLISLNKWLGEMGVTSTTGWRWRKKGILQTINIYGRLYLSEAAIADFLRRAAAGEFAMESRPGQQLKK